MKPKKPSLELPPKAPSPPKPSGPTKAQIAARYLKAIQKERNELEDQAKAQYKGKVVTVSGRKFHDGSYQYKVTVTYNGVTKTFWVPSDYQAAL